MAGADEAEGGGEVMEDGEEEGVERGSEGEQGVLGRLGVGEGRGGYDAIPDGFGGPRQRNFFRLEWVAGEEGDGGFRLSQGATILEREWRNSLRCGIGRLQEGPGW